MTLKTKKPNMDEFIQGAKAEQKPAEPPRVAVQEDDDLLRKDKTFLLRLPLKLWEVAKEKAAKEKVSLHDYILLAVKEKSSKQ